MIKYLKILIFSLFISLGIFTIGNTTQAEGKYQPVGLNALYSKYDQNFNLTFLPKGGLITEVLGSSKGVTALKPSVMFWRHSMNGRPYVYVYATGSARKSYQGYFETYSSCDEITYDGNNYTGGNKNCTDLEIGNDYRNVFSNFFSNVNSGDYMYYEYYDFDSNSKYRHRFVICRSSQTIGKSMCFRKQYSNQEASYGSLTGFGMFYRSGMTFSTLDTSAIGPAPGQAEYGGNGNQNNQNNTTINTTCPTIRQLMNNMGSKYNTGLCYNNTTYFNGESFETVTKDDIFTIFNNDYENYTNRISIYRNNCNSTATQQNCQRAFSGEYKKYSIISNAINGGADEKKLWNYCNMGLNYDPNATNCVASGYIKEEQTTEEILNEVTNTFEGIITPNTNSTGDTVFNSLCNENDPECYVKGNVRDVFGSLGNIYNKIVGLFEERKNVQGIIPDYILRITFITILFTIIFKK